jgi:putative transposase
MRKRYDKEFKAKVASEALKGEKTLQELATIYAIHPNMIALWKKQLVERAFMIYEKEEKDKEAEAVEPAHPVLSIGRQCELLGVSRSTFYYRPKEEKEEPDVPILTAILAMMHKKPFYAYRKVEVSLR